MSAPALGACRARPRGSARQVLRDRLQHLLPACSRWSECTSAPSAPSVAASRSRYQVTSVSTAARASSTSAARARRLASASPSRRTREASARGGCSPSASTRRAVSLLGGLARLGAARAAGLGHRAGGRAGIEALVGVGRAGEREVALAAVARLAAGQQLARALEVAAARAREREPLRPAEPERRRHLGGRERGEAARPRSASARSPAAGAAARTRASRRRAPGGSSIDFSSACCTTSGIVSASQMRYTRRSAENGRSWMSRHSSRTWSMRICVPSGRTSSRSGWPLSSERSGSPASAAAKRRACAATP